MAAAPLPAFSDLNGLVADSDACTVIYEEHFEQDRGGWEADNTGGTYSGLWHYSVGRRDDGLPNHTPDHSWYYGAHERANGGGHYIIGTDHQGTLTSPLLPAIPECGATTLSFSYLLDTRPLSEADFADVYVVEVVDGVETDETKIFSRTDASAAALPETGNHWLTATADLTAFAGDTIKLRFSFDTGNVPLVDPEGWYVDDIRIVNCCPPASGVKFNDLNGDGDRDEGEPGLSGWEIHAYADRNEDGLLQQSEINAGTAFEALTRDNGEYCMDLAPGAYIVVEVLQDGWHQSYPSTPVLDPPFTPDEVRLGCFGYAITIADEPETDLDFGNFESDASGVKFNDLNGDGVWEEDTEPGLPGWTILAFADDGDGRLSPAERAAPAVFTATTDCRGEYGMVLDPGDYVIVELLEDGWHQSYPSTPVLDPPFTPDEVRLGCFGYAITIADEPETDLDFGNFESDASGVKFNDLNGDGVWEEDTEPGLPGWTILAFADDGDGRLSPAERAAPAVFTATTDCRGEYGMVLDPGDYVIVELLEDGWHQSYPSRCQPSSSNSTIT